MQRKICLLTTKLNNHVQTFLELCLLYNFFSNLWKHNFCDSECRSRTQIIMRKMGKAEEIRDQNRELTSRHKFKISRWRRCGKCSSIPRPGRRCQRPSRRLYTLLYVELFTGMFVCTVCLFSSVVPGLDGRIRKRRRQSPGRRRKHPGHFPPRHTRLEIPS